MIPVEHAIVAVALASGAPLAKDAARRVWAVLAASAILFATHGVYAHRSLAEREGGFDFVVANCENAAAGRGITPKVADELFAMGINGMTSGNQRAMASRICPHESVIYTCSPSSV